MAPVKSSPLFRDWLAEALGTSGLSKREVARRMARSHPRGVTPETIETGRRTINKILQGALTPTQPTRDSIAAALERDDAPAVPSPDDDDEEPDLPSMLLALVAEQSEMSRKLERALKAVGA